MRIYSQSISLLMIVVAAIGYGTVQAQTAPLPLGSVGTLTSLAHCPSQFFQGTVADPATCYQTTVSCPNTRDFGLIFSYANPAAPNPANGTIVFFSGAGGTTPSTDSGDEESTAQLYFNDNFAVVQTEWQYDWEDTNGPLPEPIYPYNIMTAACRPATVLNYINTSSQFHPSSTAMCTQGASGGSGAIAYSLVWYGAGSYLNNVELLSGPVFSDIDMGCKVPNVANVNICATSQYGCSPGTRTEVASSPWSVEAQYIDNYLSAVQGWTGNLSPACNNTSGFNTSTNDTIWKAMSIVNGTSGGSFSYPSNLKGMAAWACYSYMSGTCGYACPNNSASEGEQFYNQFGLTNAPSSYSVTGIQSCNGAEKVDVGTDPDNGATGQAAIESHMKTNCTVVH